MANIESPSFDVHIEFALLFQKEWTRRFASQSILQATREVEKYFVGPSDGGVISLPIYTPISIDYSRSDAADSNTELSPNDLIRYRLKFSRQVLPSRQILKTKRVSEQQWTNKFWNSLPKRRGMIDHWAAASALSEEMSTDDPDVPRIIITDVELFPSTGQPFFLW